MPDSPLTRIFESARHRLLGRGAPTSADDGRRHFVRRAGMGALGILGGGALMSDEAWAAVEERAATFGITPGTVVDAQGRIVENPASAEPYLGEIMMFGGNFPVRGFAQLDGQILPINANQSLYSLLGTTYGGDGRTTFALPDLRGRTPIHYGTGQGLQPQSLGERAGAEQVTLTTASLPAHTHTLPVFNDAGTLRRPNGTILAGDDSSDRIYTPNAAPTAADGALSPSAATGGGQPIPTTDPYQVINFQVALQGIFPSRN